MHKLMAISPVGKNGQTVVPAFIRKMFKISDGHNLVGFYVQNGHVEIAPVSVQKEAVDYTAAELNQVERLARERGGRRFKSVGDARNHLKVL